MDFAPDETALGYCGDLPAATAALMLAAAETYDDQQAEQLLLQAQQQSPDYFAVYLGLYKFYFYRQRFQQAEFWMRSGIALAARIGEFAEDAHGEDARFAVEPLPNAERFYLFSHKALAFTLLRQFRGEEARALLNRLARLDPKDRVGAGLIRAAADAYEQTV